MSQLIKRKYHITAINKDRLNKETNLTELNIKYFLN